MKTFLKNSLKPILLFRFLVLAVALATFSASASELCGPSAQRFLKQVEGARELRLKKGNGEVVRLAQKNYYESDLAKDLAELAARRSPEEQARINKELTEAHARYEMSFRAKDPETGNYDKIFKVPVHGNLVPISESYYKELVQSTAPIMRSIRELSQKIYSVNEITVESLGLEALPKAEAEEIVRIIKNSIYFEKNMVDPAMKDYPFFAVAGFDAAIGDPEKVTARFFEFNSGTPSGLSNNAQLLENLRTADPETYKLIKDKLAEGDSFRFLRETMESNALAWTKDPEGISVVIGPGSYNGAHPDVASIALLSEMPLVRMSDLYIDAAGKVRLNTGVPENNPVVTGIYGRLEESFFLHAPEEKIYWKNPHYLDNSELGKEWGVELEDGVVYQFKYDEAGKRVGVETDDQGQPLLVSTWDQLGTDPLRPDAPKQSFAKAIKDRKLYFSGLGGRVVDDKRIFEAVSRYLAPNFKSFEGQIIAGPPRTLRAHEMHLFFKNPSGFVVKPPDMSGGDGVKIMPMLNLEEQAKVLAEVKDDIVSGRRRLTVQQFADLAVMNSVEKNEQGQWQYATRAIDWRIFSFMDAEGQVRSGTHGFLARTAKDFSASTNTSQGGGYAIGVVLKDEAVERSIDMSLLRSPQVKKPLPVSTRSNLETFFGGLKEVVEKLDVDPEALKDGSLLQIAQLQREVMDALGRKYNPLMTLFREFHEGQLSSAELKEGIQNYIELLIREENFSYEGVEEIAREQLVRN